jgi:hypothetical protein
MRKINLREYLSRYTDLNCPDHLYTAWLILFQDAKYKNKSEILRQAEKYILEDEREYQNHKLQNKFNQGRPIMEDIVKKKFNW